MDEQFKESLLQMINPKLRKGQTIFEIFENANNPETVPPQFRSYLSNNLMSEFLTMSDGETWCETVNFETNIDRMFKLVKSQKMFVPVRLIIDGKLRMPPYSGINNCF